MTTHENNGIQGAISKKAEPIKDLPFFFVIRFARLRWFKPLVLLGRLKVEYCQIRA
jgi:hypothetical protein